MMAPKPQIVTKTNCRASRNLRQLEHLRVIPREFQNKRIVEGLFVGVQQAPEELVARLNVWIFSLERLGGFLLAIAQKIEFRIGMLFEYGIRTDRIAKAIAGCGGFGVLLPIALERDSRR